MAMSSPSEPAAQEGAAGTAGNVQIDNSLATAANRSLRADAVKFMYDGPVPSSVEGWNSY